MRSILTTAAAAAVVAAFGVPGPAGGQQLAHWHEPARAAHRADSLVLDVPYVAQERLLCGGATVEMALRHAGARGVYARDFGSLVREDEGGIRTGELANAVRAIGWEIRAGESDDDELEEHIAAGRPVTVLLAERSGRYHYVLVVGWTPDALVLHDPDRRPGVRMPREQFRARWQAAGRWALVVLDSPPAPSGEATSMASQKEALPPPHALLVEASALFRESRWKEAAKVARAAAAADPTDPRAWALLGTSSYLAGDLRGALDAWSRERSPVLDEVRISGLRDTRHSVVHTLLGLETGKPLRSGALERARRRLALLPSAEATSLSFRALPGRIAVVEGTAIERALYPQDAVSAAAVFVPALVMSEIHAWIPGFTGGGEAMELRVRWAEARPFAGFALTVPNVAGAPGVVSLRGAWERERHQRLLGAESHDEERMGARLVLSDWASGWLRWEVGVGMDRWQGRGRTGTLHSEVELAAGRAALTASVESGAGAGAAPSYARWTVEGRAGAPHEGSPWRMDVRALAGGVGGAAPRMLWPGAGVGRARAGLLRAHPLEQDGVLSSATIGRSLLNATLELERRVADFRIARLGVAAFVDGAHIRGRVGEPAGASDAVSLADYGWGLRVTFPQGRLRLDAARGSDHSRAISLGWEAGIP